MTYVSHQTHKNEQFYDVKWSKILFSCKRDSRIAQKFEFETSKLSILMIIKDKDIYDDFQNIFSQINPKFQRSEGPKI